MEAGGKAKAGLIAWLLPVLLGVGGSIGAVAAFGEGTYDVAPFDVKMKVSFGSQGQTRLGIEAPALGNPGVAVADTHSGPLRFNGTITGVDAGSLATAVVQTAGARDEQLNPADPRSVAVFVAQNGKSAARSFGIKVGLIAAGGSLIGGLAGALGKPKQAIAGLIAGVAVVGVLGLVAGQTYDTSAFEGTRFEQTSSG
ncbi:MAG TPA: hypothetical protein VM841_01885 [Actinomycetota bacterium]|nr:hypothetical protein [Actinomycetota bacterium]